MTWTSRPVRTPTSSTFSDNAADSDVYRVTILVTDVNEAPSMPEEERGGINITGPSNISRYDEGGTGMVANLQHYGRR